MFFQDALICVKEYGSENIVSRFTKQDWHLIASDVNTEEEWCKLLEEYPDFIQSYVIISQKDNIPFAFFYLLHEYEDKRIVSFHGGGWNNSIYHTMLHFRSAFLIVKSLTESGFKVRTYCKSYNDNAYKF